MASRKKKSAAKPKARRPTKKAPAKARKVASKPKPAAAKPPPMANVWAWHELMVHDVAGARAFYGALLGWKAEEMPMPSGPYTIFSKEGAGVGGCMAIPQSPDGNPVCPPNWLVYVGVADVDATAQKAVSLGGKVEAPPMDIPGVGRFAVLADPGGATFAIFRPSRT